MSQQIGGRVSEWAGRPYEVMTVCNGDFFFFLKGLLSSLSLNCSPNTINVGDMGLSEKQASWARNLPYKSSPPVELFEASAKTSYGGDWSKDWKRTVSEKTAQLRRLLEEKRTGKRVDCPLVLMDSDCIAIKDFKELIDKSKDVQVCSRKHKMTPVPYLGSFAVFNNPEKGVEFVDEWIDQIAERNNKNPGKASESPALGDAVHKMSERVSIGEIDEYLVSGYSQKDLKKGSYIIHFKSEGLTKTIREAYRSRVVSRGLEWLFMKYSDDPS